MTGRSPRAEDRRDPPGPRDLPDPRDRATGGGAARLAIGLFAVLVALGVLAAAGALGVYLALARELPDPAQLERLGFIEETIVYDRTGQVELARFGRNQREVVGFEEIPAYLIDATTAIEDKTFWTNPGFDPIAIVAAAIDTLRGEGRGGSTITQQLVRQRLLDPALVQDPNRRIERKLAEIIQSIRLTRAFPGDEGKRRIITAYLNQNYYGNDSYGVKAAARGYFGITDLHELTLAQAALLAAIPQSPVAYDLVRNAVREDGRLVVPPDAPVVQRRNHILDLMAGGRTPLSEGRFGPADFERATAEPVVLAPQSEERWTAPHFVWAVRERLGPLVCGAGRETCPLLEQGGLRIVTTLDVRLQEIAERWVRAPVVVPNADDPEKAAADLGIPYDRWLERLRGREIRNGALVALDYQTGEVVAYVGSADYYARRATPQFQPKFDVVGDGFRQPGSAFKPIHYVIGIDDRRLTPGTMFMDVVTDFGGGYTPTDADNLERGPVRLRDALRFSLNIPAVKAVAVTGIERIVERAQAFGLRFQSDATEAGLALALGVAEVRPIDLATAYAVIANGGRSVEPAFVLAVRDRDGRDVVPPYAPPEGQPVVSPQAAYLMTDILAGNTDRRVNPYWGRFAIPGPDGRGRRPATLKTGTNNDARDLNAYGYLAPPDEAGRANGEYALVVGAWNGNSDNSVVSTPDNPIFSIDVTTFVWQGFLTEAAADWPVREFSPPDGIVESPVDPWTGLRPLPGGRSVPERFLAGTEPRDAVVCGERVLEVAGFEARFDAWLAADRAWLERARRGPGVRGGPERTATSYFYDASFQPYGPSWGPLLDAEGTGCPPPSPSPTACPSAAPTASPSPTEPRGPVEGSPAPVAWPSPSAGPTESASPVPTESASPEVSLEPSPSPPASPEPPSPSPAASPSLEPSPSPAASPSPASGDQAGAAEASATRPP